MGSWFDLVAYQPTDTENKPLPLPSIYVRCDELCVPEVPQPGHKPVQDSYGNTFYDWNADFIPT